MSGIVFFRDADGPIALIPPVDLYETQDSYVLSAELPGVAEEDVHVEVKGADLTIWGERRVDSCCQEENYHRLEGIRGRFSRTFTLPEEFDEKAVIQATLKDGVLKVQLPRSERPRKIAIRSARNRR